MIVYFAQCTHQINIALIFFIFVLCIVKLTPITFKNLLMSHM
jgi:hypothetical protein